MITKTSPIFPSEVENLNKKMTQDILGKRYTPAKVLSLKEAVPSSRIA